MELPNNEDLKRDSTVREVRQWSKASKVGNNEAFNLLLYHEKLPPVEIGVSLVEMGSTELVDGDSRTKLDVTNEGTDRRRVRLNPSISMRTFEQFEVVCPEFEFTSDGTEYPESIRPKDDRIKLNRKNLHPQSRDGRKHRSDVNDHPWMPTGEPNSQKHQGRR